jgi:hypothetical protein
MTVVAPVNNLPFPANYCFEVLNKFRVKPVGLTFWQYDEDLIKLSPIGATFYIQS